MHIGLIAEGCYPFIVGGVSSWIQTLITHFPEHTFTVITLNTDSEMRGNYKYQLPDNVIEVKEYFFDDMMRSSGTWNKDVHLRYSEHENMRNLMTGKSVDWHTLFEMFARLKKRSVSAVDFILSRAFYELIQDAYEERFGNIPFTEVFWTLRSIYTPLFTILQEDYPNADIYHTVSTGYAGVVASAVAYMNKKPMILTEHGIYTREREEELIKSEWVEPHFKDMWIQFFKLLSDAVYEEASKAISLFEKNRFLQMELGCPEEKTTIIHNGVRLERFQDIVRHEKGPDESIVIGAIVRVVPIKDLITMLHAFSIVEKARSNTEFLIMGPLDEDEKYYEECIGFSRWLGLERVTFTDRVNISDYLGNIDIHVLTSISEGQPLTVLETLGCRIPNVTTDVGDCRSMIEGGGDGYGLAGIVTGVMDYKAIADALIYLVDRPEERRQFGDNGYNRVIGRYGFDSFIGGYRDIYNTYTPERTEV